MSSRIGDAALEAQIRSLEVTAAKVLEMKRQSRPKRPIIIEFCGSPKAGKTQAVTSLTIFLKRNGFSVRVLTERASVSPVSDKRSPYFNVWTGCSTLTGLIPYLSEQVSDVDVVIADRGLFDTLCWFTWLVKEGSLAADEADVFDGFFMSKRFRQATDLVLAFTASAEASMNREYATLLTRKLGSIMAPRVLDSYVESINETVDRFGPEFKAVDLIDTSTASQNDVAVDVTKRVLASIENELEEKVGGVRRDFLETVVSPDGYVDVDALQGAPIDFVARDRIESDPSMVQLVPIAVLADEDLNKVMVFRKRRETLGGQASPELDKNLLYVGGHMRAEDSFGLAAGDLRGIARATLQREMFEEIGATLRVGPEVFCFWDRAGREKSQRHLAVVHVAIANFEEVRLRLDGYELVQPHNSKISGSVVLAAEASEWDPRSLESWSMAILRRVFGISFEPVEDELQLDLGGLQ